MNRLRVMMGVLGATVALAACGDDESETNPTTAATTTTTSATGGAGGSSSGGSGGNGGAAGGAGGSTSGSGGGISTSPCSGNTCDLTLVGNQFDAFDGKELFFGLQRQGQMGLTYQDSVTIAGGTFSATAVGQLSKGQSYNLGYFVDINGDTLCDINPTDAVWRVQVANVQTNLTVTVSGMDTGTSNLGCSGFNP